MYIGLPVTSIERLKKRERPLQRQGRPRLCVRRRLRVDIVGPTRGGCPGGLPPRCCRDRRSMAGLTPDSPRVSIPLAAVRPP